MISGSSLPAPAILPRPPVAGTRRLVAAAIGGVGASAVITQLTLMRELLGAFAGNELVFGICLGNWLLLTGLGTRLGHTLVRRHGSGQRSAGDEDVAAPIRWFIAGLLAIAIIPLFQVVAVRTLRDVVFGHGQAVGITGTVSGSLALLLPFCLVSGFLLTLACRLTGAPRDADPVGKVYFADTAGGVAGGVLFSFVLVPWLDHFALLGVPAFLNLLLAGLLAWRHQTWFLLETAIVLTAGLGVHLALVDADFVSTALQYPGETVRFRANSPYGRLVVGDRDGLLVFHENGVPLAATQNTGRVEEAVLYALSQRPEARHVLLIGGGATGDAREILRAAPEARVTYVELDPAIIAAGRLLLPENLNNPRIRTETADGRRFVRRTRGRFDLAIVDLPDPSTAQLNRFYTVEFFREARRALAPGGVLAFGLARYENYVSPSLAHLLGSVHRTLTQVFGHVLMVPGGRVTFLASDGPLTLDIAARLARRGVRPRLVNRHYLAAMLASDRLADLDRAVARPAAINTDRNPVLYYYHLRHWLSQFATRGELLGGLLGLALIMYLVRLRVVPRVVFAAGFAASGLEVVVLLVYQVTYGSLYRQVALVVTVFMAGLVLGAGLARHRRLKIRPREALIGLAAGIALLAAALPWLLGWPAVLDAAGGTDLTGQAFLLALTLVLAALVGAEFPLAGAAEPGSATAVAARVFSADLIGAALGALVVSALLIPLLGLTAVCLLTAGLNAAAATLIWRSTAA